MKHTTTRVRYANGIDQLTKETSIPIRLAELLKLRAGDTLEWQWEDKKGSPPDVRIRVLE